MMPTVYTVGHWNHLLEKFLELLALHRIAARAPRLAATRLPVDELGAPRA